MFVCWNHGIGPQQTQYFGLKISLLPLNGFCRAGVTQSVCREENSIESGHTIAGLDGVVTSSGKASSSHWLDLLLLLLL